MMQISMPRGDIRPVSFTINSKSQESLEFDNIYFTVKKNYKAREILFQKTLSSGSIEHVESGTYQFTIEPEDTNGLDYGDYVFDIEVVSTEMHIKQTFIGTFSLTHEVTFSINEA